MLVVTRRAEVRNWTAEARSAGERTALVPTMGYLHPGHLSLIEIARRNAERVAVSIFVNPLQFGPSEDLDRYPRDLERDLGLARDAGADLVFTPSAEEMYPDAGPRVAVVPERGADRLDGAARPGHFRGVLTVVAKLLGIFQPDVAVFGQKDLQQLILVRRMVADLDLPVEIVAGPIVREPDGLAMSSRNVYLSAEERRRALAIPAALSACQALLAIGEHSPEPYLRALRSAGREGVDVEYGVVVDPETLEPADRVEAGVVCAIAARVGATRLIDNAVLGT